MKPELAVLPLEVWADVFETPCITRQWLAQLANRIGNRKFAAKLQKLLHECGKHTLGYFLISSNPRINSNGLPKYGLKLQRKIPECQATLAVAAHSTWFEKADYSDCEFPETEMPENIKTFKRISIEHLDDQILDFLGKIKPLFTNVFLDLGSIQSEQDLRTLCSHLLPMLASIRRINCMNDDLEVLERHFPGPLALAKELQLFHAKTAYIPAYLSWLSAPRDFYVDGPRFFKSTAESEPIFAMIAAVRKQFLAATIPSAFVIYLEIYYGEHQILAEEFKLENAVTKEQLTVQNACYKMPKYFWGDIHYVVILRHPAGAAAKMHEWLKNRAYYEKKWKHYGPEGMLELVDDDEDGWKQIRISQQLTIGQISEKVDALDQIEDDEDASAAGPSTSSEQSK